MSAAEKIRAAGVRLHADTTQGRREHDIPQSTWDEQTLHFAVATWLCSTAAVIERRGITARLTIAEEAARHVADLILGSAA